MGFFEEEEEVEDDDDDDDDKLNVVVVEGIWIEGSCLASVVQSTGTRQISERYLRVEAISTREAIFLEEWRE